jgi:predicted N-acetyltransferase YhbS
MLLRPLRADDRDLEAIRQVSRSAFAALDGREEEWPPERVERYRRRGRHFVEHDPGGSWVAEHDGEVVGVALASRREGLWGLSLLAVAPQAQNNGIGRALLERAAAYGSACLRGIIVSSPDPRAARRYRKAGFTLHPAMRLSGTVDRAGLPEDAGIGVHQGNRTHLDLLDSVDRRVRGAAHGPDHVQLMTYLDLLVVDGLTGSGYCYADPGHGHSPVLLAATSRRVATRLLSAALIRGAPGTEVEVNDLTAEQEWAVDVGLAAGLEVRNSGFLCFRGMRPPAPYIPSGAYL